MDDIKWSNRARRQLRKFPRKEQPGIVEAVRNLRHFPESEGDIKRLLNHTCDYRLRVSRYRVLFNYDGASRVIYIQEVKKRDDQTY